MHGERAGHHADALGEQCRRYVPAISMRGGPFNSSGGGGGGGVYSDCEAREAILNDMGSERSRRRTGRGILGNFTQSWQRRASAPTNFELCIKAFSGAASVASVAISYVDNEI